MKFIKHILFLVLRFLVYRLFEVKRQLIRDFQVAFSDAELDVGLVGSVEIASAGYEKSALACDAPYGRLVAASVSGVDAFNSVQAMAL